MTCSVPKIVSLQIVSIPNKLTDSKWLCVLVSGVFVQLLRACLSGHIDLDTRTETRWARRAWQQSTLCRHFLETEAFAQHTLMHSDLPWGNTQNSPPSVSSYCPQTPFSCPGAPQNRNALLLLCCTWTWQEGRKRQCQETPPHSLFKFSCGMWTTVRLQTRLNVSHPYVSLVLISEDHMPQLLHIPVLFIYRFSLQKYKCFVYYTNKYGMEQVTICIIFTVCVLHKRLNLCKRQHE